MTSHIQSPNEHYISGDNGDTVWLALLRRLIYDGSVLSPRGKPTLEISPMMLTITRPGQAVITVAQRRLNYAFMTAEAMWMLAGRDDVEFLARYNSKMRQFSDDGTTLFGAYGPWVVKQLPYVLGKLRADPDTRQAVLTIWQQSPPATKDVPCTISMQFLIRDFSLHCLVTMRSSDAWLGLPYDIYSFTRIQGAVAGELKLEPGTFTMFLGSSHLYQENIDAAQEIVHDYQGYRGTTYLPTLRWLPEPGDLNDLEELARRKLEMPIFGPDFDPVLYDWFCTLRWWLWRKDPKYEDPLRCPPTLRLINTVEEQLSYIDEGAANEREDAAPKP